MLNPYSTAIKQGLEGQNSVRTLFQGTSMLPTLKTGMQIRVEKALPEEIKPAEIILYQDGAGLVVHRVIKIIRKAQKIIFITKGDNHAYIDCAYIPEGDLVGRVTAAFAQTAPEKNLLIQSRFVAGLYLFSGNLSLFCRQKRKYIPRFIRLGLRHFVGGFFLAFKKLIQWITLVIA